MPPGPAHRRHRQGTGLTWIRLLPVWLFAAIASAAPSLDAQVPDPQVQVRTSQPPHDLGQAIVIQISVTGFERTPDPRVDVTPVPDAELSLISISPRTSESITIVGGQMKRRLTVQHVFRFHLTPRKAGPIRVGPFKLTQGRREAVAGAMSFAVDEVPSSSGYRLEIRVPDRTLWVGEEFPVMLEWWIERSKGDAVGARLATVPLFERDDIFRFGEPEPTDTRQTIRVQVGGRADDFPATVETRQDADGTNYYVLTVTRQATALKAGTYAVAAPAILVEETVRWQRDLFNQRVPIQVRRVKTDGAPLALVVAAPPAAGRPATFAGVVGTGFALTTSVARSVVNAGDPIELELTVTGDGPLDTLALPTAEALGLDPDNFSVAAGPTAGTLKGDGSKRFTLNVRALHAGVSAIPKLGIAWFNPETGTYGEARSAPIALSVNPAEIVGADAVVAPEPEARERAVSTADRAGAPQVNLQAVKPTRQIEFSELAIETDAARLFTSKRRWYLEPAAEGGLYGLGLLSLCAGFWWRLRARRDPADVERTAALRRGRRAIETAADASVIAHELRAMVASARHVAERALLDAVLEQCDAMRFGGRVAGSDIATLRADALKVAQALEASG